ncbi:hypothetical protein JY651_16030 [Pyxidicoccus parkwayensis]|uniref:Lipoprotein n=1 Tax=Pyxidicoccus parkwayensis TaxID=2813578 RepID=A0ABX7P7A7_9BACT|nr:hypothetical protein [Pyxidicoccus parkwaysis]QSQ26345.1 hypothetical protein JY651_16030 [Pyxidicoccus parkwaysis]
MKRMKHWQQLSRQLVLGGIALAWATGCGETPTEAPLPTPTPENASVEPAPHPERRGIGAVELPPQRPSAQAVTVDPRSSLIITDDTIVKNFPLLKVMNQLVAQSGVAGLTPLQLFQSWWATELPPNCVPNFNNYAYQCPRTEGNQAGVDPFINPGTNLDEYVPTALVNRFDLAPLSGTDCGEYRIIYAKRSGFTNPGQRNLVIFEAVLPNPTPSLGLAGCMPVANFWASLTTTSSVATRVAMLQTFYFTGLSGGFMPVVHIDNYGNRTGTPASGQVRSNQFMQPPWTLREFKVIRTMCGSIPCALNFRTVPDSTNPGGLLFDPTSAHPEAFNFQNAQFPSQVSNLAINDINLFNFASTPPENSGQSNAQGPENDYLFHFGPGPSTFHNNVQVALTAAGSTLTPQQAVSRSLALSCAGCHQLSNGANLGGGIIWPPSLGFVHVSEQTSAGPFGPRYNISPALSSVFLPHRKAVLETFINSSCGDATCQPWETHAACTADCP